MNEAGLEGAAIRPATGQDADAIADVYLSSFKARYDFPLAHTDDEVRSYIADVLLPTTDTWVAERAGRIIGFMALDATMVVQLYVAPGETGNRIGSRLLAIAQRERPSGLELWTFQVNSGARRFYERHGFKAVELTDGSSNEERQPDVRYAWSGASGRQKQEDRS